MRVSPLLLTVFVFLGLAAIAVPVWRLTSGAPSYSETLISEQKAVNHTHEEIDLVIWVSHVPASVKLQTADGETTKLQIGDDGLQEAYAEIAIPVDDDVATLIVTVEHDSGDAVESALSVTAHRGDDEARAEFIKFAGFGEEQLKFDWSHHH